jgi:hypothetical protein
VGTFCWATGLQTSVGYLYIRLKTETCFNSGYPTGYPRAGQNTRARTRLGSGRVRVRPAGEKSCPCPSPSGRVPGGYPLPVPELPSLGARCAYTVRGHRARDWHGGVAVGVGNDDKLGRNGRGGHQQGKASLSGKVVGSGTHRGDTAAWRRREAVGTMEFNGSEVLRWGTAATEGSCGTPTTPGR